MALAREPWVERLPHINTGGPSPQKEAHSIYLTEITLDFHATCDRQHV